MKDTPSISGHRSKVNDLRAQFESPYECTALLAIGLTHRGVKGISCTAPTGIDVNNAECEGHYRVGEETGIG